MAEDTRTDDTGETMAANDADRPGDDRLWGGRFAAGWADVMERCPGPVSPLAIW